MQAARLLLLCRHYPAKRIYSRHSVRRYKIVANGQDTLAGELSSPVPDRWVQLRTRLMQVWHRCVICAIVIFAFFYR